MRVGKKVLDIALLVVQAQHDRPLLRTESAVEGHAMPCLPYPLLYCCIAHDVR